MGEARYIGFDYYHKLLLRSCWVLTAAGASPAAELLPSELLSTLLPCPVPLVGAGLPGLLFGRLLELPKRDRVPLPLPEPTLGPEEGTAVEFDDKEVRPLVEPLLERCTDVFRTVLEIVGEPEERIFCALRTRS